MIRADIPLSGPDPRSHRKMRPLLRDPGVPKNTPVCNKEGVPVGGSSRIQGSPHFSAILTTYNLFGCKATGPDPAWYVVTSSEPSLGQ